MDLKLMYPFGFLITKYNFTNKYDWNIFQLDQEWSLYYSNRYEFSSESLDDMQITALGYFFDIRNGELTRAEIIENLLLSCKNSYRNYLEEISYLSGRYLLIFKRGNEIKLFHDAAGLRAVCYHKDKDIIGSHDSLINEVTGNKLKQVYFNPAEISFSYYTRYESVEKLIPNMTLEINTRSLERYFPLEKYSEKTKSEIKAELVDYFNETIKWLRTCEYRPVLSLTGGGDSRMSLAILKPIIKNIETFTYLKDTSNASDYAKKTFKNDEEIVTSLVDNLNLKHNFFEISSNDRVDQNFIKAVRHNIMSEHNMNLAYDYSKIYGEENYLHIRSTALFNIGKYIFPAGSRKITDWQVIDIAKYVKKWTKIEDEAKNIEHLEHLLDHAQLDNFYNYNPLELLFVSYRLIQWHSGVVGESDNAFNTMLLLNARKIVELLLSYPVDEKIENRLFIELIEELWPILNYWNVNDTQTLKTKYSSLQKELSITKESNRKMFRSLINTSSTQQTEVDITALNGGYLLKFSDLVIKENESYEISIDLSTYDPEDEIEFKIGFFYNNQKGRNRIFVSSNDKHLNGDILDFYGTNTVNAKIKDLDQNKKTVVKISHQNSTQTKSWVEASRVWIGDFKLTNSLGH